MTLLILIPVYYNFNLLEKALLSLQNQTHRKFKVIILNNSQEPISTKITDILPADQLKIIHNKENLYYSKALNNACYLMEEELIMFMNSDVILFENTLETFINQYQQSQADCLWGEMINQNGKTDSKGISLSLYLTPKDLKKNIGNYIFGPCGSCFVLSKKICNKIKTRFNSLFNDEIKFYYSDADIMLRLTQTEADLCYIDFKAGIHNRSGSVPENILKNFKFLPRHLRISKEYLRLLINDRKSFLSTYKQENYIVKYLSAVYSFYLSIWLFIMKCLRF